MQIGPYRLLAQLGVGENAVAYRAYDPACDAPAEVRLLASSQSDPSRWKALVKRLRQVDLLKHPAAIAILNLDLESRNPYVALELMESQSIAHAFAAAVPLSAATTTIIASQCAGVLAAAHRLGLVHGRFLPNRIRVIDTTNIKVDFTGTDDIGMPSSATMSPLDAACLDPAVAAAPPDAAGDMYSLGAILYWIATGTPHRRHIVPSAPSVLPNAGQAEDGRLPLRQLIDELLAADATARPSAKHVEDRLRRLHDTLQVQVALDATGIFAGPDSTVAESPIAAVNELRQLGRFRLGEKLGEGGMGAVFRAEDCADGSIVAVKVIHPDWAKSKKAVQRLHKEARLLAEVNNPYVANLLEVNEDDGVHYLVMEFVAGKSVGKLIGERGKLDERMGLAIVADVARALADAHQRGIVHRDIKPDNMIVLDRAPVDAESAMHSTCAKLLDFGLARHVVETESLHLTQTGAILGTPYFMAPEQCTNSTAVDARTDVYALGASLFQMLAGRPPFLGDSPLQVVTQHINDAPPHLHKIEPTVSEAVGLMVNKMLAKAPADRYANAGALLKDLDRLLRGEPTSIAVHPRLPACDPKNIVTYDFNWELESGPLDLWPYVSNTERLNRAIGLPAIPFTTVREGGTPRRFGKIHKAGFAAVWEEHPFEWIEGRRMGVLREFSQGPFRWFLSIVELRPHAGGGTTLRHQIRIEPNGILGRTVAAVEIGIKARRSLGRVYRRIDAALTGKLSGQAWVDGFEEPAALGEARQRRLEALLDQLVTLGVDAHVAERLGDFLAAAPAQEVARIRPLALARRLTLDPDAVVSACLHGAEIGLLSLLWDILCPVCRIPSQVNATLRALKDHGRCEACNLDFELDFANSVELIFRAHPEIRDSELGVFCIGGPAHSPHVAAQTRVGPGERFELELTLAEGAYRLRGPQLAYTIDFRVEAQATGRAWEITMSHGLDPSVPRSLKTGSQTLALTNDTAQEIVVRVERSAPRADAVTAARAASLALFRELFPTEVLAPGQLISVAAVALLVTSLDDAEHWYQTLGDARAFGVIHEHFRLLDARIRQEGGAVVKTVGEGLVAAFSESVAAVRAALALQSDLAGQEATRALRLKVGVHRGQAMAATLNGHLDYFGATVKVAAQLPPLAAAGEVILSNAVAADPQTAALMQARGLQSTIVAADMAGYGESMVHRVRPGGTKA